MGAGFFSSERFREIRDTASDFAGAAKHFAMPFALGALVAISPVVTPVADAQQQYEVNCDTRHPGTMERAACSIEQLARARQQNEIARQQEQQVDSITKCMQELIVFQTNEKVAFNNLRRDIGGKITDANACKASGLIPRYRIGPAARVGEPAPRG